MLWPEAENDIALLEVTRFIEGQVGAFATCNNIAFLEVTRIVELARKARVAVELRGEFRPQLFLHQAEQSSSRVERVTLDTFGNVKALEIREPSE